MKIAYIYPAFINIGGADKIIIDKANYMANQWGYDVYLITDSQNNIEPFFPISDKIHFIDLDINFYQQYQYGALKRLMVYLKLMRIYKKKLTKLLAEIRPDVIISTFSRDAKFVRLYKKYAKVAIAEVHTTKSNLRALPNLRLQGGVYKILANYIEHQLNVSAKLFDEVVVLNAIEKRLWKPIRQVQVINNAVQYNPDRENSLSAKSVIFVGRAEYEKAPDRLIEIWRQVAQRHPDWTLRMFCTGSMLEELKSKVQEYSIGNQVLFMPSTKDMEYEYMNSAMCVLTSRFEGFGMVLLEAMGCGLPCIAFNCPSGPRFLITDQENGFLVEDGNLEAFADKVCMLIEHEDLRHTMGKKAKQSIAKFSMNQIMNQWDNLFKQFMATC